MEAAEATKEEPAVAPPATTDPEALHRAELSKKGEDAAADTEFHRFIHQPTRLVVPSDEKEREKLFKDNPKLKDSWRARSSCQSAGGLGVEAVDDARCG